VKNTFLLFVYGTLKSNKFANNILEDSIHLADATTTKDYSIYCLGDYPGMILENSANGVRGEIYLVSKNLKKKLDMYEGVGFGLYSFKPIKIEKIYFKKMDTCLIDEFKKHKIIYSYIFNGSKDNAIKVDNW